MRTSPLGATGRSVGRIGLGGMPLSLAGRPGAADARRVVQRAVELGVTLIDTADVYCLDDGDIGHNERLIASALREMGVRFGGGALRGDVDAASSTPPRPLGPGEVVVATKGGMVRPHGRWERNGHPDHLRSACEASLGALGVEQIDLYQFHAPDSDVPFGESVGALVRLREEGKVAAVGLSNVTIPQIREAQALVPITSVQNRYSPWDVSFRPSPLLEFCRREGITFLPYSPLGGRRRAGLLTESPALRRIGRRVGCSPAELVLAWILNRGPHLVPIPGASRLESIESSARAEMVVLDDSLDQEIRKAFTALPGVEGFMARLAARVRRMGGGGG